MATQPQAGPITNDLGAAIDRFGSAFRGDGVSPEAVEAFERACHHFEGWLRDHGHPLAMDQIAAGHVEDWEADLRPTVPHAAFHDYHRGVQQFLGWYAKQRDTDWRVRSAWRRAPIEAPGR
jgi:hypothetical protein